MSDNPSNKASKSDLRELHAKILRYVNLNLPLFDFLKEVSLEIMSLVECDALEIRVTEGSRFYLCESFPDRDPIFTIQPSAVPSPEGRRASSLHDIGRSIRTVAGRLAIPGHHVGAALHAREIVRKLLIFARQAPSRTGPVNLNEIITATLAILEHRFENEGIELARELDESIPPLEGDRAQLTQVVVNLAVNVLQAMPKEGGRITIRARNEKG